MRLQDTPLNRHVRRHMNSTGKTQVQIERECGLGRSTLNGILNGRNNMGRAVFDALDPVVHWESCHRAFIQSIAPKRSPMRRRQYELCDPQPWPQTVERMKASPPPWNWVPV